MKAKKFISLFLVFSLLTINCATFKSFEEKKGAKLIVKKKDGQLIEGELITVKPTSYLFRLEPPSLLLLDTEGKDVSIDIEDIRIIRIVKKSKAGKGALYGLLIGGVSGALFIRFRGELIENIQEVTHNWTVAYALFGATGGLLIGTISGAALGTDKTIHFEGMTDTEIQETLDKLRKKARIRDYR